jgi:hypothetical protein
MEQTIEIDSIEELTGVTNSLPWLLADGGSYSNQQAVLE